MENDFKTVTNAKGLEIPKYSKDFKKLVEKDRQLAEYLCMNYEDLDSEDPVSYTHLTLPTILLV